MQAEKSIKQQIEKEIQDWCEANIVGEINSDRMMWAVEDYVANLMTRSGLEGYKLVNLRWSDDKTAILADGLAKDDNH